MTFPRLDESSQDDAAIESGLNALEAGAQPNVSSKGVLLSTGCFPVLDVQRVLFGHDTLLTRLVERGVDLGFLEVSLMARSSAATDKQFRQSNAMRERAEKRLNDALARARRLIRDSSELSDMAAHAATIENEDVEEARSFEDTVSLVLGVFTRTLMRALGVHPSLSTRGRCTSLALDDSGNDLSIIERHESLSHQVISAAHRSGIADRNVIEITLRALVACFRRGECPLRGFRLDDEQVGPEVCTDHVIRLVFVGTELAEHRVQDGVSVLSESAESGLGAMYENRECDDELVDTEKPVLAGHNETARQPFSIINIGDRGIAVILKMHQSQSDCNDLIEALRKGLVKDLVVDFGEVEVVGKDFSVMPEWLPIIARQITNRGGKVILCGNKLALKRMMRRWSLSMPAERMPSFEFELAKTRDEALERLG